MADQGPHSAEGTSFILFQSAPRRCALNFQNPARQINRTIWRRWVPVRKTERFSKCRWEEKSFVFWKLSTFPRVSIEVSDFIFSLKLTPTRNVTNWLKINFNLWNLPSRVISLGFFFEISTCHGEESRNKVDPSKVKWPLEVLRRLFWQRIIKPFLSQKKF